MATTKETEPMRQEILEFVRKTEETITEAGRRLGETVCELVPGDGTGIRRVVDDAFDLTETILRSQREFASSLLDDVLGDPGSKRAATKPSAKRTTDNTTKDVGAA